VIQVVSTGGRVGLFFLCVCVCGVWCVDYLDHLEHPDQELDHHMEHTWI